MPVEFTTTFTEFPTEPHHRPLNKNLDEDLKRWARVFAAIVIHIDAGELEPSEASSRLLKAYQQESDFYVEYYQEAVTETTVPMDDIMWSDLWKDFHGWFVRSHGREHMPKKSEAKRKFQSDIFKRKLEKGKWTRCKLHKTRDV